MDYSSSQRTTGYTNDQGTYDAPIGSGASTGNSKQPRKSNNNNNNNNRDLLAATTEPPQSYTPLLVFMILGLVWYYFSAYTSSSSSTRRDSSKSTELTPEERTRQRERLSQAAAARFGSSSLSSSLSPTATTNQDETQPNTTQKPPTKTRQLSQSEPFSKGVKTTLQLPESFKEDFGDKVETTTTTTTTPRAVPAALPCDDTHDLDKSVDDNIEHDDDNNTSRGNMATMQELPSPKKSHSKNKKKRPPPIQILCEALSSSLFQKGGEGGGGILLKVQNHTDVGSWGGVGWWKQKVPSATTTVITLPLYKYYHPQEEKKATTTSGASTSSSTVGESSSSMVLEDLDLEYANLAKVLSDILPQHVNLTSIHQAATWYHTAERLIREGQLPYLVPHREGYKEWCRLLETLQTDWLARYAAETIHRTEPEGGGIMDEDDKNDDGEEDDDDVELSLFTDDKNDPSVASASNETNLTPPSSSWQGLSDLLPETSTIISPRFLMQVAKHYDNLYGGKQDVSSSCLFPRILKHLLSKKMNLSGKHAFATTGQVDLHSSLMSLSHLIPALDLRLVESILENDMMAGHDNAAASSWKPLLASAAFSVGEADHDPLGQKEGQPGASKSSDHSLWYHQVITISYFPYCVVARLPDRLEDEKAQREQGAMFQSTRHAMSLARRISSDSLLKPVLSRNRHLVFSWIEQIIQNNQALVYLAKSELLGQNDDGINVNDSDSAKSSCDTQTFLLGLTSTWIQFCCRSLTERFTANGSSAFDVSYLAHTSASNKDRLLFASQEPASATTQKDAAADHDSSKFSGSTYFFFLACGLLRVALHPAINMESELHYKSRETLIYLRQAAAAIKGGSVQSPLPPNMLARTNPMVATLFGWRVFLEEPEFVKTVTDFCLLQLEYVLQSCSSGDLSLVARSTIQDWMCKDPSRWLTRVAHTTPHLLHPKQAERAVECSAKLLQMGEKNNSFSPIVLTCLLRIASAFVGAGVSRAYQKQQRRRQGGKLRMVQDQSNSDGEDDSNDEEDDFFDIRNVDLYLSFDQNDLGVTVFTNRLVSEALCPTLVRIFSSLDVVEGLDMDQDHDFDKFSVKSEVSDLLLRLWAHPNGECRNSILNKVNDFELLRFASSMSGAISVNFDNSIQMLATMYKTMKQISSSSSSPEALLAILSHPQLASSQQQQDMHFVQQTAGRIAGGFLGARRLFMLLWVISQEQRIAAALGGKVKMPPGTSKKGSDASEQTRSLVRDVVNMVVHFIDVCTSRDGGTHPELEMTLTESTSSMSHRVDSMSLNEQETLMEDVLESRSFARKEIGLDVSIVCHFLLALVSRWHLMAIADIGPPPGDTKASRSSLLLSIFSQHDDVDVIRYTNILNRLVPDQDDGVATGIATPTSTVFKLDGYCQYTSSPSPRKTTNALLLGKKRKNPETKQRRRTARQSQMSHDEIGNITSRKQIEQFLDDLRDAIAIEKANTAQKSIPRDQIESVQREIMAQGDRVLAKDDYGKTLLDWVVSSSPFANPSNDAKFLHYYDNTARSRMTTGSGKTLVKEARKCHKVLPLPHINSSCFVCFSEERMDLCRAVITGPVDSPYSLGMFVFDIFFPADYPNVPPLVTFMTTGGGQIRFSPNLYVDGKVCLSLLGLTYSNDKSQRWTDQSSLAQILLSMQSQIFDVKEPYFNEGSGIPEAMKNTPAGQEGSRKHNSMLRLATMRYAMIAQLRSPPSGFEEVTRRHFSMCRKRLVAQTRRWMIEERGETNSSLYPRFEAAYAELLHLLSSEQIQGQPYDSLPPLQEDLKILHELDPSFHSNMLLDEMDQKQEATADKNVATPIPHLEGEISEVAAPASPTPTPIPTDVAIAPTPVTNNPWANGGVGARSNEIESQQPLAKDESSDDELYL